MPPKLSSQLPAVPDFDLVWLIYDAGFSTKAVPLLAQYSYLYRTTNSIHTVLTRSRRRRGAPPPDSQLHDTTPTYDGKHVNAMTSAAYSKKGRWQACYGCIREWRTTCVLNKCLAPKGVVSARDNKHGVLMPDVS